MAFDNNFIDEVKMQINIVDVIGRDVKLKKAGSNYKGLCPFHSEKTPSFVVNEEKQIFTCFGCGQKGDAIGFIQNYYKISFIEAVEKICKDYGIKLPENIYSGNRVSADKYYEINLKAAKFFYNNLRVKNNPGLEYIKSRGLKAETVKKFAIGYALNSFDSLVEYLRKKNVSDEDMIYLGLASRGKKGIYDKFRNRVIFPIFNTQNKIIGFGGRAIGDSKPKYLNSAESDIFLKKNNLYAMNLAKTSIQDENTVLIVEGYMDVISLHQAGITNVVASLGTALTDNQAKLLSRYSKNVILSYDSDNAGISAALRGIDILTSAGVKTRILVIDGAKDPDEFVKKFGRDKFIKRMEKSKPSTDFKLNIAKKGLNLSSDRDLVEYIDRIVPELDKLGPVEQDIYIKKISSEYNISEMAIQSAVKINHNEPDIKRKQQNHTLLHSTRIKSVSAPLLKIEMALILLLMENTDYINKLNDENIELKSAISVKLKKIIDSLYQKNNYSHNSIDITQVVNNLDPDEEKILRKFNETIYIDADEEKFYHDTLKSYRELKNKELRTELINRLSIAEKLGNVDEMKEIAERIMSLDE